MAARTTTRRRVVRPTEEMETYRTPVAMTQTSTLLEKLVPVLLLASVVLAFMVGILWQKVSQLQKGGSANVAAQPANNAGTAAQPDVSGKLTEDQAKKLPQVSDADHLRGNKKAQVYLVEYSDYQCPFCKQFHPTAQQVLKEYGDKVAWVFRHFPLEQIHPQAMPAAIAAECVFSLKGEDAFWKYTDYLYANQETALNSLSDTAVAQTGVNKAALDNCITKADVKNKITDQSASGLSAGVTGTPANFIVNSKGEVWLIPGALPFDTLKATIDEALKS